MPGQQRLPERDTVIVDVIDQPIPGVITVAEFNEIEVCEGSRNRNFRNDFEPRFRCVDAAKPVSGIYRIIEVIDFLAICDG
jgi:hypothetical protein